MRANKSLERTVIHRGGTVRAVALCARAGTETRLSLDRSTQSLEGIKVETVLQ